MSDPKRQAKRATRAERRAAEEASQQARAEQAAKERKQQTIIGCIVVAIIVDSPYTRLCGRPTPAAVASKAT